MSGLAPGWSLRLWQPSASGHQRAQGLGEVCAGDGMQRAAGQATAHLGSRQQLISRQSPWQRNSLSISWAIQCVLQTRPDGMLMATSELNIQAPNARKWPTIHAALDLGSRQLWSQLAGQQSIGLRFSCGCFGYQQWMIRDFSSLHGALEVWQLPCSRTIYAKFTDAPHRHHLASSTDLWSVAIGS